MKKKDVDFWDINETVLLIGKEMYQNTVLDEYKYAAYMKYGEETVEKLEDAGYFDLIEKYLEIEKEISDFDDEWNGYIKRKKDDKNV